MPAKLEDGTVVQAQDSTGTFADPYIQVYSGKLVSLIDPQPEDIDIQDIAAALSKVNRYTGHTVFPYSVGQHSLWCSEHVRYKDLRLAALLHDAPEAYIGDISRPLKMLLTQLHPGLIAGIDAKFEKAIFEHVGLPWPLNDEQLDAIKRVDNWALATEKRDLMPPSRRGEAWPGLPQPHRVHVVPEPSYQVEHAFLARFADLMLEKEKTKHG